MQLSYFNADAAAASTVINNSADISGLEIESMTLINDSTKLTINLSTLDSEFTGNKIAGDGFLVELVPYSPDLTAYVSLERDFGNFRMRLDHTRVAEHPSFPYNSNDLRAEITQIDSVGKTDLTLIAEPTDDLQINFWIRNLNDVEHRSSTIPFGPGFGQLSLGYFDAPRTVGIDMHYKF